MLMSAIASKEAVIGVLGLGYVGLPLVRTFVAAGFSVIGFDIDRNKIAKLNAGRSYLQHLPDKDVEEMVLSGAFRASLDFSELESCHALLMCVPTPLNRFREPEMRYVVQTAKTIGAHLQPGQLVVLESTTYPGTTDDLLCDILTKASGLKASEDFFLAYSPERENPGKQTYLSKEIPKVVGGIDAQSTDVAAALYQAALDRVVPVSDSKVAEMSKLLENIFRNVNIALVNEMKVLCHKMDIDIWEVIEAASTKPFGFMPFYPGPGLGGHCIPIDPFYLTWKAREFGLSTRFIELAGEVNSAMPAYVLSQAIEALNDVEKSLRGASVLVLGLAYKADIDDVRESPSLEMIEMLQERGAQVTYHDPHVPSSHPMRRHNLMMESVPLGQAQLEASDLVIVMTAHSQVDYGLVGAHASLVLDTRGVMRKLKDQAGSMRAHIIAA